MISSKATGEYVTVLTDEQDEDMATDLAKLEFESYGRSNLDLEIVARQTFYDESRKMTMYALKEPED